MSEKSLEDRMLQSAFDNFMSLCNDVESKMSENDSIFQISNQIEILKEVFIKAEFQLECYRCHQKLLVNDQNALKKAKTAASEELNLINSRKKVVDNKNTEALFKENQNLKEQIEIYSAKIDNSVNLNQQLSSFLHEVNKKVHNKSEEIERLSETVENKREKSTNANNSLSKHESDKSLYMSNEKKKGLGRFIPGFLRRNV